MTVYRLVVCILLVHKTISHRGALPRVSPRAQFVGIEDLGSLTRPKVFRLRFKSLLARLYEAINQTPDPLECLVWPLLDVTVIVFLVLVLVAQRRRDSLVCLRWENKPRFSQFPAQIADFFRLPILGRFQRRVDCQKRAIRDFQVCDLWKRVRSVLYKRMNGHMQRTLRLVFASALSCLSDPSDSASLSTWGTRSRGLLSLERLRSRLISVCGMNGLG